jgi:SAM-dependent methyltransferase
MRREPNETLTDKMRQDWDARARTNVRYFVQSARKRWNKKEFYRSGQATVSDSILTDLVNICQGGDPKLMRVLEIGCGVGRVTRALADIFGEVHAVDVSGEMIRLARRALADKPNVFLHQNNGMDLSVLGDLEFDFALSFIVFQHIPDLGVIENYVREVHRVLRPGRLFKFQVQGFTGVSLPSDGTWIGAPVSEQEAVEMAVRCGFEPRYLHGAGSQYFWLWYFKQGSARREYAAALWHYRRALQETRAVLCDYRPASADIQQELEDKIAAEEAAATEYARARARLLAEDKREATSSSA